MKKAGLALVILALTPTAFASRSYIEVWNPPEARVTAPRRVTSLHTHDIHRHVGPHTLKVHAPRVPVSAVKLAAKQRSVQKNDPAAEPHMREIPRQITPEGNVLRVGTRGSSVKVAR